MWMGDNFFDSLLALFVYLFLTYFKDSEYRHDEEAYLYSVPRLVGEEKVEYIAMFTQIDPDSH